MSKHVRTRCGKRRAPERARTLSSKTTVNPVTGSWDCTVSVGGCVVLGPVHLGDSVPDGVKRVERSDVGEAVGPRSVATIFLPDNFRQRREFLRKWERAGLAFRPLVKGGAPLRRGTDFAYGVQGDALVIAAMRGDTRCQGLQEARLARHSLNTGEFARKPRAKDNPVRRQVTYRETNGQPLFVRI